MSEQKLLLDVKCVLFVSPRRAHMKFSRASTCRFSKKMIAFSTLREQEEYALHILALWTGRLKSAGGGGFIAEKLTSYRLP